MIVKKVLIAHHMKCGHSIPHYRIPFYNAIEQLKPNTWGFDVVFDPQDRKFLQESLTTNEFRFPILEVDTMALKIFGKTISYQTFWKKASKYDLVIVAQQLNNLTYPLCQLHQLTGKKFAYWGYGNLRSIRQRSWFTGLSEKLKTFLALRADGFFAYTPGVKSYLGEQGFMANKVFVLNNTIDIKIQRSAFEQFCYKKDDIKQSLGLENKKVLLLVARFNKDKRLDFLLKAFSILQKKDPSFHLLLVGSGGEEYLNKDLENITYFGSITNPSKLAPIYVASDVFSFPGLVGLGPLQALCYNLPVITIKSSNHKPEIEYLSPINSIILESKTSPKDYAMAIIDLFKDSDRLKKLQDNTWSSIEHLTIEQMAMNFIKGVNEILI